MSGLSHPPNQTTRQITRRRPLCRLEEAADGDANHLHPLLKRIFENRNVQTLDQLDYSLSRLHPPEQLKGIESATSILQQTLDSNGKILVVGDYDADGATATAVALLGLRALGAGRVEYLAPNRFEYGYGLSAEIAEVALRRAPDLVITVDNGISSIAGVALLRAAGVSVVVTDHHLAGAELPEANAIVNPNQPGCDFPSKALAGVGVMFYLLLSLRARLRKTGRFERDQSREPNLAELLDLVALGTVADMVPLDHNNRILVAQGIARVHSGRCRPGLAALMEVAGKLRNNLVASDFGFLIGPRLNAAGRMDDISTGIECLLAEQYQDAMKYAQLLEQNNRDRRRVEQTMQQQAVKIVEEFDLSGVNSERLGLCLFNRDWHQGVVGLVASRIVEKFNQPVIAFAPADDGRLRGSARSVAGLHIRDLLESISTRHPGLIEKFGGHTMAAGLTISAERLDAFSDHFSELVSAHFANNARGGEILTDGELATADFTLETAELVCTASPWGQQFPAPLFDGEFRVTGQKIVGEQHLKMILEPVDGTKSGTKSGALSFDAIVFRHVEPGQSAPPLGTVKAAYQLEVNEFRGRRSLQLLVKYIQPLASEPESTAS